MTVTDELARVTVRPDQLDPTPEPVWYFRSRTLYRGKFPPYYDMTDSVCGRLLVQNYEAIRAELVAFWADQGHEMSDEYFGFRYVAEGWKTMSLYAGGYKHRRSAAKLPVLTAVIEQIPNMSSATVSVLKPHVKLRAHVGGTSAIIRTHLGIYIPDEPPAVGIRVTGHTRGWEPGRVFGIEMARRHLAWNDTDEARIAITVDTIKDEFAGKVDGVNGRLLGLQAMWLFAHHVPVSKRLPQPVLAVIHTCFAIAGSLFLKTRRLLGLQPRVVRGPTMADAG
jgi:hypothetical protein